MYLRNFIAFARGLLVGVFAWFPALLVAADLWNLEALQRPPKVEWSTRDGAVQEVYYTGEPHGGKPTRVFAYLARPEITETTGRLPAVVLVHGGGGQAFRAWAERWAQRGYVALAMDLSGNGPGKKRLADGGPPLGDPNVFLKADSDEPFRAGWPYHAVAAAIRGHSLLAALPEVDPTRIGITGISWGGYVTCLVASLDHRLKVAVPVYGAGFLHRSSYWMPMFLDPMPAAQRDRWVQLYDPSSYLSRVGCPILFVNGSNDPRFFLDGHRDSVELVPSHLRHAAIIVGLKHGHLFNLPEVDRFIDAGLKGEKLPPQFGPLEVRGDTVRVTLAEGTPIARGEVHYAPKEGSWAEKKWTSLPATLANASLAAEMPPERPLLVYFSIVDAQGVRASNLYSELARP